VSAESVQVPPDERKTHIELADAENRIDGLTRDPQTNAIFEAYAAGEIAVTDIVARLRTLFGL